MTFKKIFKVVTFFILLMFCAVTVYATEFNVESLTEESLTKIDKISQMLNVSDEYTEEFLESLGIYLKDEAKLDSYSDLESRTIIVMLEGESLYDVYNNNLTIQKEFTDFSNYVLSEESFSYLNKIENKQLRLFRQLEANNIDYELRYTYSSIFNGVAIYVDTCDIDKISNFDYVENIIYSESYDAPLVDAVTNNVEVYTTGIYDTTNISYDGSGMVVAVLDTGIDYKHNAFSTMPTNPKISYNYLDNQLANFTSYSSLDGKLTADEVYYNEKIPYAYDYADGDSDVFPTSNVHGVHVAGIIAGQDNTVTEKDHEVFANGEKFLGVAPNAQLAIMKVFSDYDSGAGTDAILAALSDCVTLGVDVINMSLGSSAGFSREADKVAVNKIYDKVRESGISLVVAAGNSYSSALGGAHGTTNLTSNPDSGTIGSPSTYDAAISVASVSGQLTSYFMANDTNAIYFNESSNSSSDKFDFVAELLNGQTNKTFNYVVVGGYGKEFNYTPAIQAELAKGNTIAVVKRGDISFEDKQKIAYEFGAVGCIIYNNVSGTISASLGNGKKIPTCTISMDMATKFIETTKGTISLSTSYKAGPFMSDFSSWGPTADLELKPEITAHGGEIISAVVGGYDEFSGTSMACPNLAGVTTLLRQYVKEDLSEFTDGDVNKIADLVYQLLMSTATIINNNEGNPYSPRKQGAGLADISKAMATEAYLYVPGTNKTKLSLGDDKQRTGEYTLRFNIKNMSNEAKVYILDTLTMTETVSSDGITVAEKAYMLNDGAVTFSAGSGATISDGVLVVNPKADVELVVTIRLTNEEKAYLDTNFKNGMYVEGFVCLKDASLGKSVDLNIPWLAFYGDWLDAPVFDASSFEVSDSYFDDSVDDEDKLVADVYETTPVAKYYNGTYYMPLGQYIFIQPDGAEEIQKSTDKVAVSYSQYASHELYAVYCGLLRSAKAMKFEVTDVLTGKVIYEKTEYNIRKSYGAGSGSSYPGAALMELSPADLGLANNTQYKVTLTAALDYENGEMCNKNTYEFYFWVDFEMPSIVDYNYRFEYDKNGNKTVKMDVEIYDNHYLQSVQFFVVDAIGDIIMLTDYPIAVEGGRGITNKITVDITDWLNACQSNTTYPDRIGVYMYDYALNSGGYLLPILYNDVEGIDITATGSNVEKTLLYKNLNNVLKYTRFTTVNEQNYINFKNTDNNLDLTNVTNAMLNNEEVAFTNIDGEISVPVKSKDLDKYVLELYDAEGKLVASTTHYQSIDLTTTLVELSVGDIFEFNLGLAGDDDVELLIDDVEITLDRKNYIYINGTQIYANSEGTTKITVTSKNNPLISKFFKVTVVAREEEVENPSYPLEKLEINSYKDLTTGVTIGVRNGVLDLDCGSKIQLFYETKPWYATDVKVTWESSDPDLATVDKNGKVTCLHQGSVDIWAKCTVGNLELIKAITINIGEEYKILSGYLYTYNGAGGEDGVQLGDQVIDDALIIPADLGAIYIGHYSEGVAGPFYGVTGAKTIVVPEGVTQIGLASFGYSSVETIYLPSSLEYISTQAFIGCYSLKNVYWIEEAEYNSELGYYTTFKYSEKCTAKNLTIANYAFAYDRNLQHIDLSKTTAILDNAFYYCRNLESVDLSNLRYAGSSVFSFCYALKNVISSEITTYGKYMFYYCSALTEFDYYDDEVYSYMFYYCKSLQKVTFHQNLTQIDSYAFNNCTSLNTIEFNGNTCGAIGAQAFSGCSSLSSIYIPNGVKSIGNYAFRNCTMLMTISFGRRVKLETIGMNLFYGCTSLTSFTLPEGGSAYYTSKKVVDDAGKTYYFLYSLDGKTLIFSAPSFQYAKDEVPGDGYTQEDIYNFFDEEGNLIATEIGAYAYSQTSASTAKELDELIIPEGVTKIGAGAFFNNAMKRVVLPSTLEVLDEYAFYGCSKLVEIVFQSNVKRIERFTFYGCSSLTTIELPASLEYIGESAIRNCTVLSYIKIPASVRVIDGWCFMNDGMLETVEFENGSLLEEIDIRGFANCVSLTAIDLPKGLKTLGDSVFEFCVLLEEIVIPGSLENWGSYTFSFCTSLANVVIEEGVEYIGMGAFMYYSGLYGSNIYYNSSLKNVVIPKSVKEIYPYAFAATMYLEKIELPAVEYIYDYAFMGSQALKEVKLGANTVEYIGAQAFYGNPIDKINLENVKLINAGAFYQCTELSTVNLESLEQLGAAAFYGCTNLIEASLPNCTDIYSMAFMNCGSLETVNIKNATVLGEAAFFGCESLTSVTLSSDLEEFYPIVFVGCSSLKEIKLAGENGTFFTDKDGVLYKNLASGGYELVAYPGGNEKTNYSILEGTKRVGEWSFAYCYNLTSIDIASSIESIGAYAFYGVGLNSATLDITYNFKGLQAPKLEGEYNDESAMPYIYTNFSYNFGYIQTNICIPANGIGYDSYLYDIYFKDPIYSSPAMEETTQQVYDLIDKLANLDTLTQSDVNDFYRAKQLLSYLNNVQKALVTNSYKLIDVYDKVLAFEDDSNEGVTPNEPTTPQQPNSPQNPTEPTDNSKNDNDVLVCICVGLGAGIVGGLVALGFVKFIAKKGGKKDEE